MVIDKQLAEGKGGCYSADAMARRSNPVPCSRARSMVERLLGTCGVALEFGRLGWQGRVRGRFQWEKSWSKWSTDIIHRKYAICRV
jgi:hypothetical protein